MANWIQEGAFPTSKTASYDALPQASASLPEASLCVVADNHLATKRTQIWSWRDTVRFFQAMLLGNNNQVQYQKVLIGWL